MKRYDHFPSGMYVEDMGQYVLHTDHVADKAAEMQAIHEKVLILQARQYGLSSERDTLAERVRVLEEALRNIVAHEVDYMTRNHLGDPEKQSYIIQARAALRAQKEGK